MAPTQDAPQPGSWAYALRMYSRSARRITSETVTFSASARCAAVARSAGSRRTDSTDLAASPTVGAPRPTALPVELARFVAALSFLGQFLNHLVRNWLSALGVPIGTHRPSPPNSSRSVLGRSAIAWITNAVSRTSITTNSSRLPDRSGPATR